MEKDSTWKEAALGKRLQVEKGSTWRKTAREKGSMWRRTASGERQHV